MSPKTYRNPIIPGFNPDPSIVRVGKDYFVATSTFEYFPGVPIYHSVDLVNWTLIGHALSRPSQLDMRTTEPSGGIFAPTLRYHEKRKRFYMTTSVVHNLAWGRPDEHVEPRGFYVWTDDIFQEARWSEPVYFDTLGFDQDLFFDDDGKVYLSTTFKTPFNGDPFEYMAVYASEIDLDTGRNLTRPVLLRRPLPGVISAEGSHIVKKDGWYYLFTADNGTFDGHQEWVSRSRSPLGPYAPGDHNPIVFNDQDMHVRATGHMDVVQDTEGGWWGVMLAVRPQTGPDGKLRASQLGRETFLVPIEWPTGGWPVLNDNKPVSTKGLTLGRSMADQRLEREWRDDFDKDTLSLGWYHTRTPLKQDWSLTHRPGWLTLFGNPYTIDKQECPTALFRKQTAFSGTWITELDFCPSQHGDEAGTTVYYSMYAFMAIGIRKSEHPEVGRYVFLRWVDPDTSERKEKRHDLDRLEAVQFRIEAKPESYTFSFKVARDASWTEVGILPMRVLMEQSARESVFTGTHLGIYAQGWGSTSCLQPASFSFASFTDNDEL